MTILKLEQLEQLDGKLKDAHTKQSTEILNEKEIEKIKNLINLTPEEKVGTGECLYNSYQVAEVTNAKIIEGIAHVIVEKDGKESETLIKHAWNIKNENQFDVTKDFVWPNLSVRLKSITYTMVEEFSKDEYNLSEGSINFKSDVELITTSLKFHNTKSHVMSCLNILGLENKFYKDLLQDCIRSIEEKTDSADLQSVSAK